MTITRRFFLGVALVPLAEPARAQTSSFMDLAFELRAQAERAGDQPYGAVLVRGGVVIGEGASAVLARGDPAGHAEREAIRSAMAKLGPNLAGSALYSTSRPCAACETAAWRAGIVRLVHGPDLIDLGAPRPQ